MRDAAAVELGVQLTVDRALGTELATEPPELPGVSFGSVHSYSFGPALRPRRPSGIVGRDTLGVRFAEDADQFMANSMDRGALPTFVIIGAQKSATRWLRINLGHHPEIFTAGSEMHFWNNGHRVEKLGARVVRRPVRGPER